MGGDVVADGGGLDDDGRRGDRPGPGPHRWVGGGPPWAHHHAADLARLDADGDCHLAAGARPRFRRRARRARRLRPWPPPPLRTRGHRPVRSGTRQRRRRRHRQGHDPPVDHCATPLGELRAPPGMELPERRRWRRPRVFGGRRRDPRPGRLGHGDHYGGGARWFVNERIGVSFDLRFWALASRDAVGNRPRASGNTRIAFGAGVSLR